MKLCTGIAAASPSAQMVRPSIARHAIEQVQVLLAALPVSMR
jgi:hypothetical protein